MNLSPNGAPFESPGQRPGKMNLEYFAALKGRNFLVVSPFQGLDFLWNAISRGVAPGFQISPRWGRQNATEEVTSLHAHTKLHRDAKAYTNRPMLLDYRFFVEPAAGRLSPADGRAYSPVGHRLDAPQRVIGAHASIKIHPVAEQRLLPFVLSHP